MRKLYADVVRYQRPDNSVELTTTLAYNQSVALSESTFGFERRLFSTKKADVQALYDVCPSLKAGYPYDFARISSVETDSLLDFPFNSGLLKMTLIRDNFVYRLLAWGTSGKEKYRLYTRDFEQFCGCVESITGGRLRPTTKLWSSGYIVTVVGPELKAPDTPSTDDFENQFLEMVRNKFNEVLSSGAYGLVESDVYAAQANIEDVIGMLHNAARRFTPSKIDFENEDFE